VNAKTQPTERRGNCDECGALLTTWTGTQLCHNPIHLQAALAAAQKEIEAEKCLADSNFRAWDQKRHQAAQEWNRAERAEAALREIRRAAWGGASLAEIAALVDAALTPSKSVVDRSMT
jgi:hypothetical protein